MGGRFEAVRSALANTAGVSDIKVPGQNSLNPNVNPNVKPKGQIIQYTGHAKPEDVIAILQKNIFFKAKVAERPDPKTKRGEQAGADQPATAPESKSKDEEKPKTESKARPQ